MANEEHFLKTISQWEFDYGLFTDLPRILPLLAFLRVHSNSKEASYLSWQNKHPNFKTTCHIKLKFFLWTKLLENVLLAKHLISVAVALIAASSCINRNILPKFLAWIRFFPLVFRIHLSSLIKKPRFFIMIYLLLIKTLSIQIKKKYI